MAQKRLEPAPERYAGVKSKNGFFVVWIHAAPKSPKGNFWRRFHTVTAE